jgi:hypothetical protein
MKNETAISGSATTSVSKPRCCLRESVGLTAARPRRECAMLLRVRQEKRR